jgi:hypothetical protein
MPVYRKAKRIVLITVVVYALLVATHLGEFWPFSIYPMFSRGGHPWSRALVRDVTGETDAVPWTPVEKAELPGKPYALVPNGIDQIDLANFVSKTQHWDANRVAGLERMFHDQLEGRLLLIMRADGHIDEDDSVRVLFIPYALLGASGTELNPTLNR